MNALLATFLPFLSASGDFGDVSDAINDLISEMWTPCLAVAGSLAGVWGLYLGIKFWTAAGDEQKKKSAKSALISFVIGIIVIFAVFVGAPMGIGALATWASDFNAVTYITF